MLTDPTTETSAQTAAADAPVVASLTLDFDIRVNDLVVQPKGTTILIRKPSAGEFRGLTLLAVSQLDYASIETMAPRITTPRLSREMVAAMDPADLMQMGGEIMDFLLPTAAKADSRTA